MASRSLIRNTEGATTLEFAIVSTALMGLLLGGMQLGLILWTHGTLQSIAAQTARCAAIGSPLCTSPQTFATHQAAALLANQGLITGGDLTVTVTTATSCLNEPAGTNTFKVVTITVSPWAGDSNSGWFSSIFPKLSPNNETVTACYPI